MSDYARKFELITPVVLISFNRPEMTRRVFSKIREFRPTKLYLVSDAARDNKTGEAEVVASLRTELEESVDWNCDLRRIYARDNMGCAERIATALDEVFSNEEEAIILEDDCVPNNSFFEFCQVLLDKYRNNRQVLSICGCNEIKYKISDDYFFSKKFGCWGWATWRRAWSIFDYNMSGFDKEKDNPLFKATLFSKRAYWNLMAQFNALANTKEKFSWAYIFYYYSILNDGYHIYPKYSLIENIGFSLDSTHTKSKPGYYYDNIQELTFPLKDQQEIKWNREYDAYYYRVTQKHGWIVRLKELLGLDINVSVFDLRRNRGK